MRQFFLCTVFSFSFCAFSQEQREYKTKVIDFNFLFYLFENQQFDDATFYSEQLFSSEDLSVNQKDSLAYLLGILSLEIKMHENASSAFEKISEQSPFYVPALFYSFYAHTQKKQYQEAREILNKIPQETSQNNWSQLILYQKSALALLTENYTDFEHYSRDFSSQDSLLKAEQEIILNQYKKYILKKDKSPIVAAVLSALVPGLGKVYTKNNGQALSSFVRVSALTGMTIESMIKFKLFHPQAIVLTAVSLMFHTGNIWASALSPNITKNEQINELKYNVSTGIRIPLDYYFQ